MAQTDPYAVLGVPRDASRDDIARVYRRLAKQHHPDRGAEPSPRMARINEAWHTLSDPTRRAAWDRRHAVVLPPHWPAQAPERPMRPRPPQPVGPPSARDSGWLAVLVVGAAAVVIVAVLLVVYAAPRADADEQTGQIFTSDEISLRLPDGWTSRAGTNEGAAHRTIAHIATFEISEDEACTDFGERCRLTGEAVPPGEASIVVTAWEEGTPPVPEPANQPYGVEVGRRIGDAPAAFRLRNFTESAIAWWQLSPPSFPDRWIEVEAHIGGQALEQAAMLNQIEQMLRTVAFDP